MPRPPAPNIEDLIARRLVHDWFHVPRPVALDTWVDGRLILPREMSPEPGVLRLSRTPYLREIMVALEDPQVEEVVLQCGTQLGKSTVLLCAMAKVIGCDPAPAMLIQPTIDLAKRFSRQRVAALINANDVLRTSVRVQRSREGGNTLLVKEFTGGILVLSGANSAASLASMPTKWVFGDEIDDWPLDVDGQGDPTALVIARQDSFGSRARRIFVSSPKRSKGVVGIESRRVDGTDERYEVPCPHCNEFQILEWGSKDGHGIKWQVANGRPVLSSVAYCCRHCGCLIPESAKTVMLDRGRWVQTRPGSKRRSFHLSSLYSPLGWLSWRQIVAQWIKAKEQFDRGDAEPLKSFINMRLAETWNEEGVTLDAAKLKDKAEDFRLRLVVSDALVLLAAVDVQADRFEVDVWAVGPGAHMWTVDTMVIVANPAVQADWKLLDAALFQRYQHEDGFDLGIEAVAIDTGFCTHEAYNYVRLGDPARKLHAIKGADDRKAMPLVGRPSFVDVNYGGNILKRGVRLWPVGVNAAKDRLFGLMRATQKQVHFSSDLDDDFYDQMTAEQRVQMKTSRGKRFVWVKRKGHVRNERLDLAVYVVWLIERLRVGTWTPRIWDALRARYIAQSAALKSASSGSPDALPPQAQPLPATPRWRDESHVDDTPVNWF